jgi:hypothetical protein
MNAHAQVRITPEWEGVEIRIPDGMHVINMMEV